jgi:hypothetical protein
MTSTEKQLLQTLSYWVSFLLRTHIARTKLDQSNFVELIKKFEEESGLVGDHTRLGGVDE